MSTDRDSDINPASAKQDFIKGLEVTKEAIEAKLKDMVNTAMMSESTIIDCFDMDKSYFNAAVCGIATMISENAKQKNAGAFELKYGPYCEWVGQMIMEAIYNDLHEAAGDRI